jgi:flagellar basal-body rod protein FlgG
MPISQLVRSAVSGMVSHKLSLDVIANNLANVNTSGFKGSRVNFQDVLYQANRLATSNQDLRIGAGVRPVEIQPFFTQGSLVQTDSPTDMAVYGNGFFRVRLPDGQTGYTRNGSFRVDANGLLTTTDGLQVEPQIRIPADLVSTVTVDTDGTIRGERTQPDGTTRTVEIGQLQIATFVNPEGLEAVGQSLFRETANSGGATVGLPNSPGFGQVVGQALEQSNVNMADEMANLITAQRAYGFSLKALQTIDEMIGMANNIRANR